MDFLIYAVLNDALNDLKEYVFEGEAYNKIIFYRLLVFYVDRLIGKSALDIKFIDRWTNAYYCYAAYLNELKKPGDFYCSQV
ncbi:MAG: hypothetical protein HC905_22690 [Bacteroidales bacterium]|nr:hypothetical protein [Bacteroidales bacterium]